MFDFDIGEQKIDILDYVKFKSSNSDCPVTSYRLVDSIGSQTEFVDNRIRQEDNGENSLLLITKTD